MFWQTKFLQLWELFYFCQTKGSRSLPLLFSPLPKHDDSALNGLRSDDTVPYHFYMAFHNIYTYKRHHSSSDGGNGGGKKEEKPTVEIKDDDALVLFSVTIISREILPNEQ